VYFTFSLYICAGYVLFKNLFIKFKEDVLIAKKFYKNSIKNKSSKKRPDTHAQINLVNAIHPLACNVSLLEVFDCAGDSLVLSLFF
jgi:hypothetical protein